MGLGSHGWRVPLVDVDAGTVRDTFDAAVRSWWPRWSGRVRLWCEDVPVTGGDPTAEWCRDRELRRPVSPAVPLRAVLLSYRDGSGDLILVADRAFLDAESLRMLADVTLGRSPIARYTASEPNTIPGPAGVTSGSGHAFRWATGDRGAGDRVGTVQLPLPGRPADALGTLAAATALVLERYAGEAVEVPVVRADPGRPAAVLGAFDVQPAGMAAARAVVVADDHGEHYEPCQGTPCPLTVLARRAGGEARLELRYRLRDLDSDTARRLAEQVARVYSQLSAGVPAAAADLLGADEEAWTATLSGPTVRHPAARIDEILRGRVRERPDAVAVVGGDEELTYGELWERAAALAGALRDQGVRPGDRVGICLDRSPGLVTAMLSVLLAGAAYVPLDPHYPDARLAYTIEDARLRLVITERDLPGAVTTRRPDAKGGRPAAGGPVTADAGVPAYVIYTSGSTGRPKGVVVPHANVTALLEATRDDFALGHDDVWTLFHSSAFDFSVWEIWGCLLTGGRLVVVPYWTSRSPEEFHALLVEHGVTVLNQTPSAFAQLAAADRERSTRLGLRLVIFGGEPLDPRMLLGWFDRYPESSCRLVNMYGITETTVHVTAETIRRVDALAGSRSVGAPLPGWQVSVRDVRGRRQPVGAPGEICVAGAGVAMGYLDRPELTAERFVPDPWTGGRMYRSGDLGRLLPDGRLEHLGRIDSQVKVRGFRIELGEIRAVLLDDPAVTAAAVVLGGRSADSVDARIDAYVTPAEVDTVAIRRRAGAMLPEYMVPASVTAMATLPLTVNGKLDTARLPAPAVASGAVREAAASGSADLRTSLAAVWQEVLGVSVTPADNFFDLGGNSLSAVRIASLMRERGLPRLPLRDLYRHPTVGELADRMAAGAVG